MLPAEQACGGVLVELAAQDEHLEDAAPEQLLGDAGRGPIQSSELPIGTDDAGGDEGVDMWLPVAALKLP